MLVLLCSVWVLLFVLVHVDVHVDVHEDEHVDVQRHVQRHLTFLLPQASLRLTHVAHLTSVDPIRITPENWSTG